MERIGANNVMTIFVRIRDIEMVEDMFGALAVQRQLFTPFQHRLVIVIELVFRFAQHRHVLIDA
ncbi:Uncharacterised protein [Enterobacter cloacae]|nr:Uncharacterised protein [Enterobacter cloacae]